MLKIKEWLLKQRGAKFIVLLWSHDELEILTVRRFVDNKFFIVGDEYCDDVINLEGIDCRCRIYINAFLTDFKNIEIAGYCANNFIGANDIEETKYLTISIDEFTVGCERLKRILINDCIKRNAKN